MPATPGHCATDIAQPEHMSCDTQPRCGCFLQPLDTYDEERTVFIHDWFHTQGDVLAMSLNRYMCCATPDLQRSLLSQPL